MFQEKNRIVRYLLASILIGVVAFVVNTYYFRDEFLRKFSEAIFYLAMPIVVFSVINLFVDRVISGSWIKYTNYYVIFSLVIVLLLPNSPRDLDYLNIGKETISILLAGLYSGFSLFLIILKTIKNRG